MGRVSSGGQVKQGEGFSPDPQVLPIGAAKKETNEVLLAQERNRAGRGARLDLRTVLDVDRDVLEIVRSTS